MLPVAHQKLKFDFLKASTGPLVPKSQSGANPRTYSTWLGLALKLGESGVSRVEHTLFDEEILLDVRHSIAFQGRLAATNE
jgi:hypothetical protein